VANPNKAAVSFILSSARDILQTVSELIAVPVIQVEKLQQESNQANLTNQGGGDETSHENSVRDSEILPNGSRSNESEKEKGDDDTLHGEQDENEELESGDFTSVKSKGKSKEDESDAVVQEELSAVVCDWRLVVVLRDSGIALSSSLFQSLSDSEGNENTRADVGVQLLYTQRRRRWSSVGIDGQSSGQVISAPERWPGKYTEFLLILSLFVSVMGFLLASGIFYLQVSQYFVVCSLAKRMLIVQN